MTSQIPFTPLTSEALARLTPAERNTFALAAEQVAADQKPSMMTIAGLVETVGRLIGEQQPEAPAAELAALKRTTRSLADIVARNHQAMEAARIEMRQNGPHAGMQWVLNSLGDVWDDPETEWDGKESAQAWFNRTESFYRAAKDDAERTEARSPAPVPADPASRETLEAVPLAAALGRATGRLSVAEDVLAAVRQRAQDWTSIAPGEPQSPVLADAGRWILAIIGTSGMAAAEGCPVAFIPGDPLGQADADKLAEAVTERLLGDFLGMAEMSSGVMFGPDGTGPFCSWCGKIPGPRIPKGHFQHGVFCDCRRDPSAEAGAEWSEVA